MLDVPRSSIMSLVVRRLITSDIYLAKLVRTSHCVYDRDQSGSFGGAFNQPRD